MNNKLNSLCIIAGLLMGSQSVSADCYYSSRVPDYNYPCYQSCSSTTTRCYTRCYTVKHKYHHKVRHHYRQDAYDDCDHTARARRGHYSISTYMVYNTLEGNFVWVPGPCGGCQGTWVRVESYPAFSYEPYRVSGCDHCYYQNDFDMDTRTGDDGW